MLANIISAQLMKWIVLGIVILMYAVVIITPQKKAHSTLVAAALVILLGAISAQRAFIGDAEGSSFVSWSILMIYVGSLAIAELFIYSRVPARIADEIVNRTAYPGIAIIVILIITGLISALVENVATVLLMAPIALSLSKKINIKPTYFIVGLAVMSNLQGTATLIGDPPSMIFASFANVGFNDFFFYLGKPSIFFVIQSGMIAGAIYFAFVFSKTPKEKINVESEKIISLVPTFLLILMIVSLAACSFIFNSGVTLTAGITVLLLGALGVVWYKLAQKKSTKDTISLVKNLDWETILFLIGIFITIGALEHTGVLNDFAMFLSGIIGENVLLGFVLILLVSIVISGFVDNVPYIIAMLPVTALISSGMGIGRELYMFALLVGSCIGGNLTPFGASANIIAVGILKKEGISLSFPGWLKIGVPFTFISTTTAAVVLWLIWR
jgi:Na+/H+ antiporter NhaD/arsenite permease-like protein